MSNRLSNWATRTLDRTDRRGFLTRTAVFGSAVVASPAAFALKPNSAYAAICSCNGQSCDCTSLCCDGYTEFCCTIYGDNDCPPGSVVAGWWKADGSGFCDNGSPQPRYYLDCNSTCACSCGSSGVCSSACSSCSGRGGCASGNCANRKSCVTRFRYGQCNNDVPCVGPIICRVVTCTPPWTITRFDCNASVATDNRTGSHNRACLQESDPGAPPPPPPPPPVIRRLSGRFTSDGISYPVQYDSGTWSIRLSNTSGPADITFEFGGEPDDEPVIGDWDGDGVDGIGILRNGRTWHLRNDLSEGDADIVFDFGRPGDVPVVGDWDGRGRDGVGIVRDDIDWFLRNSPSGGNAQIDFRYGTAGDTPIVGDWEAQGFDVPGIVRDGSGWFLRNAASGGNATTQFTFPGDEADVPTSEVGAGGGGTSE